MGLPQIDNRTEFVADPKILIGKEGEALVVLVKASFELLDPTDSKLTLPPKERTRPLRPADVPWGEPEVSSIAYPSDFCLNKPGTDVIVLAVAHPPPGPALPSYDTFVQVGELKKTVRVFGLRVWQANGAGLSAPGSAGPAEMRYENAWGGVDGVDSPSFIEEARNPVGKGVALDPARLTHQVAPCLEDPDQLISSFRTRPEPAGMGAIGRHWQPRRRYLGTYDEAWKELRAPLPPRDQDDRFEQCASPGLVAEPPLLGGEAVGLLNLVPGGGARRFTLPRIGIEVVFRVPDRAPHVARPHLDTLLIDCLNLSLLKPLAIEMVWRASVPAPRKPELAKVIVAEFKP
ncbi:MAG TPA: DUF2169 domain-containing protein [Polyangiaceae bacterium]